MTSSPHGPHELGYTRATMVMTKRSNLVTRSNSLTITLVRIGLCNSRPWSRNR